MALVDKPTPTRELMAVVASKAPMVASYSSCTWSALKQSSYLGALARRGENLLADVTERLALESYADRVVVALKNASCDEDVPALKKDLDALRLVCFVFFYRSRAVAATCDLPWLAALPLFQSTNTTRTTHHPATCS